MEALPLSDAAGQSDVVSKGVVAFDALVAAGAVGASEGVDEVAHAVVGGSAPGGASVAVLESRRP